MACASCGTTNPDGTPSGCGSKGHCASGSCNRMNTFDWLTLRGIRDVADQHFVEVSFKRGTRKDFFYCPPELGLSTGDTVVVEADNGTDTGYITLSGEIVFAQMRRKQVKASSVELDVIRAAHARDLERLREARRIELETLVRARVLAYATESPIKLTDVEYQADLRKATFYYTSEERVDFRELIKSLAREFRVRVEMRQIGARQEAARLGGIGSCGRELCCSTWLTDFKNVNTSAARYQGLALNPTKLSGQCGRLKCCLNYELDTYLDALQDFPKKADKLRFPSGRAVLVKTDVFKRLMTYQVSLGKSRGPYVTLTVDQVHEVMNTPEADVTMLIDIDRVRQQAIAEETAEEFDYEDTTGAIDIPLEKRQRKKKGRGQSSGNRDGQRRSNRSGEGGGGGRSRGPRKPRTPGPSGKTGDGSTDEGGAPSGKTTERPPRRNNRRRDRPPRDGNGGGGGQAPRNDQQGPRPDGERKPRRNNRNRKPRAGGEGGGTGPTSP